MAAIKAAWSVVQQKPLLGWGLLSAPHMLSEATGQHNYVDNSFLQIVVELGLMGFLAFGVLIVATFWIGLRMPRSPAQISRILALLGVLGMSALASFLSVTQGYAAFCLLVVLVTVPSARAVAGAQEPVVGPSQVPIS